MFRKNLAYSSNQSAEEELSQPPWSWSAWAQISMTCIQYYLLKRVLSLLRFEYSSGLTSPHPDLIFVTNITNIISGEKLPCGEFSAFHVWHKFFRMTDVEKSEILHIWHVFDEKMSPHMGNLCYFVVKSVLSKFTHFVAKSALSQFTHFYVEKNWTKFFLCGKKWQIWGLSSPEEDPSDRVSLQVQCLCYLLYS